MKAENGASTELEGLSSQLASAVGELLRAQQDIEARDRAVEDKERKLAELASEIEARSAAIASRAADLDRKEQDLDVHLRALEEREREIAQCDARSRDLAEREEELRNREAELFIREQSVTQRETELADVSAASARLTEREQAIDAERSACEESAVLLARYEAEIEARSARLTEREQAFESVCAMLRSMTTALNEPTADNLSAALAAASKANENRPTLVAVDGITPPTMATAPSTETATYASPATADEETAPDLSDLTDEEHRRVRMLQQLGTASVAEIVAMIRAERGSFEPSRKKRRLGFLK